MSVQFGRWNFEGQPPSPDYIGKVSAALAPYGPDSNESYSREGIGILYRAFHTTKESRREKQPWISPHGVVITWDGRLDNRADLISDLRDSVTVNSADVAVVAAAYEKWGANCLGKLIGDWAVSIWNPRERSVLLAKDPIGTKHLYYSFDDNHSTWCTILDPLVLFAGRTFQICEEYIAGWFALAAAAQVTPYVGIHAVPPSSSVLLRPDRHGVKHTISKYWDFDPAKRIRYRTDAEYEEHFRSAFATAVQRRLRSDRPVLAELSGGMDSSSIVCMSDLVIARGQADCPSLDTITWYDESKPNWGELPCFTKVEEKRGRTGFHIDFAATKQRKEVDSQRSFLSEFDNDRLAPTLCSNGRLSEPFKRYEKYITSEEFRITLSGIGGSEFLGDGVPTPRQELQNLLTRGRFIALTRQLNAWGAKMRKPRLPLLWEAVRGFFPLAFIDKHEDIHPAVPWFHPGFARRNRIALCYFPFRMKLFGSLPSFQDNIHELNHMRRVLAGWELHSECLREVRYPYLDRDLLEFAYAIPREQIVGVGRRRYLMKRALVGIVPDEVLNRRKKKTIPQEPPQSDSTEWPSREEIGQHTISSSAGIIDLNRFLEALQKARRNEVMSIDGLKRTLFIESWLRHLTSQGVLKNSMTTKRQDHFGSIEPENLKGTAPRKSLAS